MSFEIYKSMGGTLDNPKPAAAGDPPRADKEAPTVQRREFPSFDEVRSSGWSGASIV